MASILQIVVACSVYFCSCFESLVVVVALSNLFSCMVQVPSYALLSEICLIRHRAHLATLNTFNSNCGWLIGLSLGLVIPIQFYYVALCFPSVIFLPLLLEAARVSGVAPEDWEGEGGQENPGMAEGGGI